MCVLFFACEKIESIQAEHHASYIISSKNELISQPRKTTAKFMTGSFI